MSMLPERILHVDLTHRKTWTVRRPELFIKYLGGAGAASKLLLEECPPKIDPFSPAAPIILATGPLVGIFPSMTKCVAMFKSPLTGNLGESHAGGYFSTALHFADYGAIVIKGASHRPVTLVVENEATELQDALPLWRLSPFHVKEAIKPRIANSVRSVVSIGRAGENLVHYSGAIVDRYHHFGRLGLGAIMGSKKLKAVCVSATDEAPIVKQTGLKAVYNEISQRVVESDLMKKYQGLGTAANVLELNELRALPSRNFSESMYEKADRISGERFAESFLEQQISCPGCPIPCIHLGSLSTSQGMQLVPYNYEPIFALGINLDVSNPRDVLQLISCCEQVGIDAIMTGAVLAWATEAYGKGLITADETMCTGPVWGCVETYLEMIGNIADVRNEFYAKLAQGVDAASERYGGKEFAVSLGKNSPAGYFTGYGFVVGTIVGLRHSHLSNAGYDVDQMAMMKNVSPEQTVESLVEEEDWLNVLNSLVACHFSRKVYNKGLVVRALASVGIEQSEEGLARLGKEISYNLSSFKKREGFDLTKERIPKRLLEIKGPVGRLNPLVIEQMISYYIESKRNSEIFYWRDP